MFLKDFSLQLTTGSVKMITQIDEGLRAPFLRALSSCSGEDMADGQIQTANLNLRHKAYHPLMHANGR